MKKVYYSFVLVLMTLMSMNVLADTPIKLDVDDASRIRVKVNYSPIENIKNGVNELTVPQYGSVQIEGSVLKPSCKPILLSTQFHKPI